MNVEIRNDFPILRRNIAGRPLIYFDSAATALKPQCVIDKEREYSTRYSANVHRGRHRLSEEASDAYEDARATIARHLNISASCVIFLRNATEAINFVASGLPHSQTEKVAVSLAEHHSNILPWMREFQVVWLDQRPDQPLHLSSLAEVLRTEKPRLLAFSAVSNVTGVINPVQEICELAREHGVLTCVDASQAAPHARLDLGLIGCDFLVCSGHKMLGPTGIGILTGRHEALETLRPLIIGGGCVERVSSSGYTLRRLPYRLEAGTPNISGAIALATAFDYIERVGYDNINDHDARLGSLLIEAVSTLRGVFCLTSRCTPRAPIVSLSFESEKATPEQISIALSENFGIMTRSGHFCAHPLFESLGHERGMLRVSLYLYNTAAEIESFRDALEATLGRFTRGHGMQ